MTLQLGNQTIAAFWAHAPFSPEHEEQVLQSPLIANYLAQFDPTIVVGAIQIKAAKFFGSRVGIVVLEVSASDAYGRPVMSDFVVLRGNSVAILVILRTETAEYTVTVNQLRPPVGGYRTEIPAGMLDGSGNVTGKAVAELEEELGITIEPEELMVLSGPIELSPGLIDERITLYAVVRNCTEADVEAMRNRKTGLANEGEHITVGVIPLAALAQSTDAKSLLAYHLYQSGSTNPARKAHHG